MTISIEKRLLAVASHYWQKFQINTLGRLFVTRPAQSLRHALNSIRTPPGIPHLRIAITAHVYYVELAPDIIRLRNLFDGLVPVFLTAPLDRSDQLIDLVRDMPNVFVFPCENRGRDIAPFLSLLGAGTFDAFDAVLKLHTKRSPHLIDGNLRRKLLFSMLCGERFATYRLLEAFKDPATGLVGWEKTYRTDPWFWMANRARVLDVAERMDAGRYAKLGFFEGSMFWFRPKAIDAVRDLRLPSEAFEAEAGQLDGTLHHAIERCFTIAAWARGYTVRDISGRIL